MIPETLWKLFEVCVAGSFSVTHLGKSKTKYSPWSFGASEVVPSVSQHRCGCPEAVNPNKVYLQFWSAVPSLVYHFALA